MMRSCRTCITPTSWCAQRPYRTSAISPYVRIGYRSESSCGRQSGQDRAGARIGKTTHAEEHVEDEKAAVAGDETERDVQKHASDVPDRAEGVGCVESWSRTPLRHGLYKRAGSQDVRPKTSVVTRKNMATHDAERSILRAFNLRRSLRSDP